MDRRMRLLLSLFALVVASTAGCSPVTRQRLVGRWQVGLEMDDVDLGEMTAGENTLLASLGQTLLRTLKIELELQFRVDNTFSMTLTVMGNSFRRDGTWRVLPSTDETTTVETRLSEEGEPKEWQIRFLSDDDFQTIPPEGARLKINHLVTFRRIVTSGS